VTRAWRVLSCAIACVIAAMHVGCAPDAMQVDRTGGVELEFMWSQDSEQRKAYYRVTRDGEFASAGGVNARDRDPNFRAAMSDAEIARFIELLRATGYASRGDESGDGEPRSELAVRDADGRTRFVVFGADPSIEALRAWLAELSMRQFRDVIEAQPEAGPRKR
jgi:hypothetical protein